ncbi:hypothetical protein A5784_28960 [Mycobacterium sp. 852013-50091_SCH5140682]|nr:hypothetical protein A5784_28960 [Mycobacterium sp. 852013-50091_SCH5140682]
MVMAIAEAPVNHVPSVVAPAHHDCLEGTLWRGLKSRLPSVWVRTAPWRQAVQHRRITLLNDLAGLDLGKTPCKMAIRAYLVEDLLEDANRASCARVGPLKWWWGTEIERAWSRLREVDERMIGLVDATALPVYAARAAQRGHAYLDAADPQLQQLDKLRNEPRPAEAELRSSAAEVLRTAHAKADHANREARYLRNRLLIASVFCVVFAAVIVAAQAHVPTVDFVVPHDDWHASAWVCLGVVMLFGAVGALFTAIPAVSNIPTNFGPFNLPLQQGLLKIAFGPLVAVVGIALLGNGIGPMKPPQTVPDLLLMAVIFGAGQHAVTRYVDKRAGQILTAAAPTTKTAGSKASPGNSI